MQELHGMLFPDDVEVPEQHFYRIDFGSDMMWDLNGDGYVDLAHQRDVESLETEVIDTGTDSDGIQYAVCQTRAVFPDGTFMAVSGADETSQQVSRGELTREVQASLVLTPEHALQLGQWLQENARQAMQQREQTYGG